MIFIDSNVLIDILGVDQDWQPWSRKLLRTLSADGDDLVISTVVLAEIAGNAPDLDSLLRLLSNIDVEVLQLDGTSAFVAGQVFRRYRRARREGAGQEAILADFLIGAQALETGSALLTRDAGIYHRYFPDLPLITPETHP